MTIPATGYTTYILSAERSHLSAAQNGFRTTDLMRDLGRLFATDSTAGIVSIQEVEGSYKGEKETSFAVTMPATNDSLFAMLGIASEYEQESVLALIENGQAFLHYCGRNDVEPIGRYKALQLDEVADYDAWSIVKATGEAFTFA